MIQRLVPIPRKGCDCNSEARGEAPFGCRYPAIAKNRVLHQEFANSCAIWAFLRSPPEDCAHFHAHPHDMGTRNTAVYENNIDMWVE